MRLGSVHIVCKCRLYIKAVVKAGICFHYAGTDVMPVVRLVWQIMSKAERW